MLSREILRIFPRQKPSLLLPQETPQKPALEIELFPTNRHLGDFFACHLLEFFQKTDTGPLENLFHFIKTSASKSLPAELHQARREIFEPLFTVLNGIRQSGKNCLGRHHRS